MPEPKEPECKKSELIHLLDIVNQRLRHLHDSLWKEEAHYTWLSYILVGGLIYLLVISRQISLDLLTAIGFLLATVTLSSIGILVCIMGYKVIRLEGTYFHTAIEIRNRLHLALKLDEYHVEDDKKIFPDDELEVKDWDEVEKATNKCLKQLFNCKATHTIRDFFQVTMLLPLIIFCLSIPYSVISFILYYKSMS